MANVERRQDFNAAVAAVLEEFKEKFSLKIEQRLPYYQSFGGASALSKEQYMKINGLPNNYWGWGGDDNDISNRLPSRGMKFSRPGGEKGKCLMIHHKRDAHNEPNLRFYNIRHTRQTMESGGNQVFSSPASLLRLS